MEAHVDIGVALNQPSKLLHDGVPFLRFAVPRLGLVDFVPEPGVEDALVFGEPVAEAVVDEVLRA